MGESDRDRFGDAISCFNSAETPEEYERALTQLIAVLPDLKGQDIASARLLRGKCLLVLGRPREAVSTVRELLDDISVCRLEAPPSAVPAARLVLAEALQACGERREAIEAFLGVVPHFREKGDKMSEGNVHRTVGLLFQELGALGHAIQSLQASREVLASVGPSPLLQQTLHALGHTQYLAGDMARAISVEEEALRLARNFGDVEAQSHLIHNLGEFAFTIQDFRRAIKYLSMSLAATRAESDEESVLRYVLQLGACHTETGAWRKAIDAYDEARQILLATGREDSIMFASTELGRAQVMVDLKRYDEASPLLSHARELMVRWGSDTGLLDKVQRRLDRETSGPLNVDCVHRTLHLALKGSTKGLLHSNPRPIVDLTDERFLTSELSTEDRHRFSELAEKVSKFDYLQPRYESGGTAGAPGATFLPMIFEYVDDVHAFEIKWSTFQKERRDAEHRAKVQAAWEDVKDRIRFQEGRFRGDHVELLKYLLQLARIAQAYAEAKHQDGVRQVALHAADFIEIQTDDPMLAAAIWAIRLQLLLPTYAVSDPGARELVLVEMRRCLEQERQVFRLLNATQQVFALSEFVVETWYNAGRDALGPDGYANLVDLVAEHAPELEGADRIRHAIAVGSKAPARGTGMLDAFLAETARQNSRIRITLAADFETARALMRFRAECPDGAACQKRYGPFAPYLHREVRSWDASVFAEAPPGELISLGEHSVHAFVDGNLVVMKRQTEDDYVPTLMHELEHRQFRAGQQLRADDGRWLQVKRDVPTASAWAYFLMMTENKEGSLPNGLNELFQIGVRHAQDDPKTAAANVRNALRYYDDLATQETASSYASGALLLGIAFGLYGSDQSDQVESYIQHLSVMDHDEAYEFGRREAPLQL
jgi:tetratricopeptide (TPR) repeat protein